MGLCSLVTIARIATVAWGVIVLSVGVDSFRKSSWYNGDVLTEKAVGEVKERARDAFDTVGVWAHSWGYGGVFNSSIAAIGLPGLLAGTNSSEPVSQVLSQYWNMYYKDGSLGGAYKLCFNEIRDAYNSSRTVETSCPDISMEYFYVSVIAVTFVLSLTILIVSCALSITIVLDLSLPPFKYIDAGYHFLGALLLLTAGIVYIVSASQIKDYYVSEKGLQMSDEVFNRLGFRVTQKYIAGALTLVQAGIYAIIVYLVK